MAPKTRKGKFDFTNWSDTAILSTKTRKVLLDNGLRDKDTLLLISPQDLQALQLPLAQRLLLRQALVRLGNRFLQVDPPSVANQDQGTATSPNLSRASSPEPGAVGSSRSSPGKPPCNTSKSGTTPAGPSLQLLEAGRALDDLLGTLADPSAPTSALDPPQVVDYDPRIHLTLRATTRKALKIFSFLPDKVRERIQRTRKDRLVLSQGDDGFITMQSKTPDSYSITPAEWNAANMRILGQLLALGDLSRNDVEFYLAYTVQVNELLDLYEWQSILTFDSRYRELQAEYGFRWGDLRMAAHSTILLPKRPTNPATGRPRPAQSGTKTEDCKKWLASGGRACPFGPNCRYAHRPIDATAPTGSAPTALPKNGPATHPQMGL